jgi:acyl-coenzyme A synthetase/AMP-(fatty) acid ligase
MTTPRFNINLFNLLNKGNVDPEKKAVTFVNTDGSHETVTFQELFENSNRLAHILKQAGVGKGDTFVMMMRNHPEFLYAMTAAATTGAIMVPIDPRYKGGKLEFIIKDSKAKAAIIMDEFMDTFLEILPGLKDLKIIAVGYKPHHKVPVNTDYPVLSDILSEAPSDPPEGYIENDPTVPCQIIFTSGTTGDPKGVVLRADRFWVYGMMGNIVWNYQPDDIPYTGLSMTHGNAQAVSIFPALAKEIPAVLSERFTKSRIWDICREYGCTTFSLLGGMMSAIYNEPPRPDDVDNPVRRVISAGTPRAIWEAFEKRFNLKIHEWYGAVEGGLAHNPPGSAPVGSFGKPIEMFMEMKVVDENDDECPPNVPGELISRMKGGKTEVQYLGKEKESKEKTRGGWLRSGDICHTDENGNFYFDYRKGTELRRHGDFIQPDYVEKVIGEHEDVSEVCVYGIPAETGAPGESDLVAALTMFPGKELNLDSIREVCKKNLEPNSIPSYIQLVQDMPKSASEKIIDRELKDLFKPDAENVFKLV